MKTAFPSPMPRLFLFQFGIINGQWGRYVRASGGMRGLDYDAGGVCRTHWHKPELTLDDGTRQRRDWRGDLAGIGREFAKSIEWLLTREVCLGLGALSVALPRVAASSNECEPTSHHPPLRRN
jgi:hypothetical protein